jgi:hypothetical protein
MKAVSKNIFRLLLFTICAALSFVVSLAAFAGTNKAASFAPSKSATANYAVGSIPLSVTVADFNNDGKLDIVTANYDSETASVLIGNGDGTFQTAANYGAFCFGPRSVAVGDFNGDTTLDFATADGRCGTGSVFRGNGNGSFQGATGYGAGFCPVSVITGLFNADGILDLVVVNAEGCPVSPVRGGSKAPDIGGGVSIAIGNGNGTFQNQVSIPVAPGPNNAVAGDYNRDNKLDLAVTSGSTSAVSILLGNGNGTFQSVTSYPAGSRPVAIAKFDFNNDNKLDLAVTNGNNASVSILLGNGDGTFQSPTSYAVGLSPISIIPANVNGDSKTDLVTANIDDDTISVLLGNAGGTFQPAINYPVGTRPSSVASGDFDRDGRLDLVVANSLNSNVSVLLNCPALIGVSPTSKLFMMGGGEGDVQVSPMSLCSWTAMSNDNWIEVTSDESGNGSEVVTYILRENFTGSARQGTLSVGPQTVTITQDGGAPNCGVSIATVTRTFGASGGGGMLTVTTANGCAWQTISDNDWIVIYGSSIGIGNGSISYSVLANSTGGSRKGTITVGGQKYSIKQKGS